MPLHIFFTTDIHGSYFTYDFRTGQEGEGGLQRAYAFVSEQRNRYGEDAVMLLDGGDIIQGGPEAYFFNHVQTDGPHPVGEMCRLMGYDAGAVGNHDIESGQGAVSRFLRSADYPLLAANITDNKGKHPFPPYIILQRGGMKVAVLGFSTPATKRWLPEELCRGYEFQDILMSARRWVEYIRQEEQPDLLIALLHSGWQGGLHNPAWQENVTQELARTVPGFDLILFGHDHFSCCKTEQNPDGRPVTCLNAGCYGYDIAEAVVERDDEGRIVVNGFIHDIRTYSNQEADSFRQRFDNPFRQVLDYTSAEIGTLSTRLDISQAFLGPSHYMSLIHSLQLSVSHADISICSPYSMDQVLQPGPLTVADLFTVYWFEDRLYTLRMTGGEIKNLLERSYALWTNTVCSPDDQLLNTYMDQHTGKTLFKNLFFCFDTAAGIDYEVDVTRKPGEKISILRLSDGRPFDIEKTYTVTTIAHRANGGGQMLTVGAGIPEEELSSRVVCYTPYDVRHYLRLFVEEKRIVNVPLINNWKFLLPSK